MVVMATMHHCSDRHRKRRRCTCVRHPAVTKPSSISSIYVDIKTPNMAAFLRGAVRRICTTRCTRVSASSHQWKMVERWSADTRVRTLTPLACLTSIQAVTCSWQLRLMIQRLWRNHRGRASRRRAKHSVNQNGVYALHPVQHLCPSDHLTVYSYAIKHCFFCYSSTCLERPPVLKNYFNVIEAHHWLRRQVF